MLSPYAPFTSRPARREESAQGEDVDDLLPPRDPARDDAPGVTAEQTPYPAQAAAPAALPGDGGQFSYQSYRDTPILRPRLVLRFSVLLRSVTAMLAASLLVATVFTWWTPNAFLPATSSQQLSIAAATQAFQAIPTVDVPPMPEAAGEAGLNNIGIVSGHRGIYPPTGLPDPGAVCASGLTEREVNEAAATRVVALLQAAGYQAELLDEFDARLSGYRALAMVSIHADSCEYVNDIATGFKVASFEASSTPEQDQRLVQCLIDRYSVATGMSFHPSITYDMTRYHNFAEIAAETPGAIIEIGFLYLDGEFLVNNPDLVAQGIAEGVLCYLRGELVGGTDVELP